jgi:putative PIN family toxin of toxin-antitoxin system
MKIMIDTNIFVSSVLFPTSIPAKAVGLACEQHNLILCTHIIEECYDVINRKFSHLVPKLDKLLNTMVYESVTAPRSPCELIADPKDAPILNAAILHEVDVIISGDKHFWQLDMEHPQVLKAAEFLEHYGS